MAKLLVVPGTKTELSGPYECPDCGGHMMLDTTFLDQVGYEITCPYCQVTVSVDDEEDG